MNFIKRFFKIKTTLYDEVISFTEPLIIKTYRRLGKQNNCAPTSKTSDKKILEIYKLVMSEFKTASREMGNELSANNVNYIVYYFLNIYEKNSEKFFYEHIKYEIMQFKRNGLRQSFRNKEISFFN